MARIYRLLAICIIYTYITDNLLHFVCKKNKTIILRTRIEEGGHKE